MSASADQLSKLLDEKPCKDFPAISVAIGRTDRLIWQYAAGYADLSNRLRNSADTAFGIGSITKVFVAVILLQLSEEGQMTLNHPLSDWLEPAQLAGIANAQVATIRQLLSHYAGIPCWEDQTSWIHVARGKSDRGMRRQKLTAPAGYSATQRSSGWRMKSAGVAKKPETAHYCPCIAR